MYKRPENRKVHICFALGKHFANEIFDEINKVKLGNTNTAFKSFVKKNGKLKNEVPFLL